MVSSDQRILFLTVWESSEWDFVCSRLPSSNGGGLQWCLFFWNFSCVSFTDKTFVLFCKCNPHLHVVLLLVEFESLRCVWHYRKKKTRVWNDGWNKAVALFIFPSSSDRPSVKLPAANTFQQEREKWSTITIYIHVRASAAI